MKVERLFIAYKTRTLIPMIKGGQRGICPLGYFNYFKMKPIHVYLTKKEAEDWLFRKIVGRPLDAIY